MEDFLHFMEEILEAKKDTLTLETAQDEVETWDSLMQLRLIGEIEARYGIMIPMDEVSKLTTLGDFYRFIG